MHMQVLLKSDYWKKFEGTVMKQGTHICIITPSPLTARTHTHTHTHTHTSEKCKSAPKQSVETHSAWYLIPPKGHPDVDWDVFPEDIEFCDPDEQGFRGFIVEFYNIISGMCIKVQGQGLG